MHIACKIESILKRILPVSLVVVLLAVGTSCIESKPTISGAEAEDGIFELVNDIRSASELEILDRSAYLDGLAKDYVENQFSKESIQSNDIRYLLSNSWKVEYSGSTPSLTEGTAEAQVEYCLGKQDMEDAIYRPEARATGIAIAITGDTIYYSGIRRCEFDRRRRSVNKAVRKS